MLSYEYENRYAGDDTPEPFLFKGLSGDGRLAFGRLTHPSGFGDHTRADLMREWRREAVVWGEYFARRVNDAHLFSDSDLGSTLEAMGEDFAQAAAVYVRGLRESGGNEDAPDCAAARAYMKRAARRMARDAGFGSTVNAYSDAARWAADEYRLWIPREVSDDLLQAVVSGAQSVA